MAVVEQRLLGRGSEVTEVARKRLAIAPQEIESISSRWPHVIINDDVDRASQELVELIEPLLC